MMQVLLDRDEEYGEKSTRYSITDLEKTVYIPEGGEEDSNVMLIYEKMPLPNKIFIGIKTMFVIVNVIFQIWFFMYVNKIGINQDKYDCLVDIKVDKNYPCAYDENPEKNKNMSVKKLIKAKCPGATNV